ncbi:hypothetical protein UFOVP275_39 [uncultured Caudovirales phage]|uniref:Phage P22-like portal protein n=1 Tax=uncultured Caudovirales phage TaxID=2100421 RepID=A0A6J5LMZ3_9CAUD|nr:hypothetical protein UFOVP275_39 [uncultured Caudovirales phage]
MPSYTGDTSKPSQPDNPLDSQQSQELHTKLLSYYRQELDRQSENRFQMAVDEDYYDSIQWSEEEAKVLEDRGQAPIVYNVLAQSINWIIGSEKRGRMDFKILPRTKEDTKPAELKTLLLKYISDVNRLPFHRSRAFEDAIKVGIGWMEDGANDDDDGEPIYSRYESWRNILHDSAATELDFSDGRYIFRSKWVDLDIAKALFPKRHAQIEDAAIDASLYNGMDLADGDVPMDYMEFDRASHGISRTIVTHKRKRVRLIECEYRAPETVQKMRGGKLKGEIYDDQDPNHIAEVALGNSVLASKLMMRVRVAIMTTKDLLWEGASPYKHNRFRFTPIWCYRRGRDNLPYGIIRPVRDIQDDVNKRASKAQHILSSNKVIMDEGALPEGTSLDEFAEEVARADAILIKRKGYEMKLDVDRELAAPHLELMSRGINMIQQVGGVTDELLGRTTNAVSGIAVQKRQEQGSLATNKPFDNLRLASQMQGELQLSLLEQFCTAEKSFRITNQRGVADFHTINDGLPENEITRTKADFIISEAEWRATMRQAAAEQLMEAITRMPPEIGIIILDLAIDSMDDLPNKDEIAKRIRSKTGMKDPEQSEPTPEDIAAEQAKQEADAFNKQMAVADLEGKKADAFGKQAKAFREMLLAEQAKAETVLTKVDTAANAMVAAQAVITMPTIAKVADGILKEAGWQAGKPAGITMGLPPMQGSQPFQQAPQPQQQPPQLPPMPDQSRPQAIAMPPQAGLSSSMPVAVAAKQAETQALTQSVAAMKEIGAGTVSALSEVGQAIAAMAEQMKASQAPKTGKVIIKKNGDGSFEATKTEE